MKQSITMVMIIAAFASALCASEDAPRAIAGSAVAVNYMLVAPAVTFRAVQTTPAGQAPAPAVPAHIASESPSRLPPLAAPPKSTARRGPAVTTPASVKARPSVKTSTPVSTAAARTAYINEMYVSVVPANQRAALAGHYVLGYNVPGLACGTGCSGLFNGVAKSSFNATFFTESLAYQRNTLAHEAAHAYGFLFFKDYAAPSWAAVGGWQAQFHLVDRGFVRIYDAEAWASCVAWKESGFNDRVDQITNICTPQAAALAMRQIT